MPMVRMGEKFGLYRALHEQGPMTPAELARRRTSPNAMRANGCRIRRHRAISDTSLQPASSPCRPSRRWCSPSLTARTISRPPLIWRRSCWRTSRRSKPRFAQARVSVGAIRRPACSARPGVSSGRRLQQQPCGLVAAGAGRRHSKARVRRDRGRCRLRARVFDNHDGEGLPQIDFRRLRLSSRVGRAGAGPRRAARSDREYEVRSRHGERFSRQGPGPGDLLRLPARHGRSGRRRAPCAPDAEARRKLDDRRASGRRPARGQYQSGRAECITRAPR